jgi:hypothetical protein
MTRDTPSGDVRHAGASSPPGHDRASRLEPVEFRISNEEFRMKKHFKPAAQFFILNSKFEIRNSIAGEAHTAALRQPHGKKRGCT